jgi:hypothetical protein
VPLGNAASFGALSFGAMTNGVGALDTVVNGDIGSSTSIDIAVTHPAADAATAAVRADLRASKAAAARAAAAARTARARPRARSTFARLARRHVGLTG